VCDRHGYERITNGRAELIANGACVAAVETLLLAFHSTRPRVAATDIIIDAAVALAHLATFRQRVTGVRPVEPYRWGRQNRVRHAESLRLEALAAIHSGSPLDLPEPQVVDLPPDWEGTLWALLSPDLVLLVLRAVHWESAYRQRWMPRLTWRYMAAWVHDVTVMFWCNSPGGSANRRIPEDGARLTQSAFTNVEARNRALHINQTVPMRYRRWRRWSGPRIACARTGEILDLVSARWSPAPRLGPPADLSSYQHLASLT
jgi:hypothetical protein